MKLLAAPKVATYLPRIKQSFELNLSEFFLNFPGNSIIIAARKTAGI